MPLTFVYRDDIVSILAGLSPSVIMEIATRAMNFWTYQTSQESAFQAMVLKNAQERLMAVERQTNSVHEELRGETGFGADPRKEHLLRINLVAEVDTLSRKLREMLEQIREKDRQISKLQGNYTKLQRKHLLGGSSAAVANAINDEMQHSMANIAHAPRSLRVQSYGPEGFSAQPPILTTPASRSHQSHQPQAFIPTSARKNETPVNLFNLHRNRSSEDLQQHEAHQAQRKADAYPYQGNHTATSTNQAQSRRHPTISPEQQALLAGVVTRHSYTSRQPLGTLSNNSNNGGGDARIPMLNMGKPHAEMRALNDSGFGMKPPMIHAKVVSDKQQRYQQLQVNRPRAENQGAENMSRMPDKSGTGSYADRVMALQGRVLRGGQQQGGVDNALRRNAQPRGNM
ncbi:hypothetical protein QFC19_003039 [Naganishia cerealis]|uniref:Uncharacterized protein n=1 Tax=Naganishia cerealis TaxID=610337 RepID=A0ACC2W7Z2_9TREE|nr:hypothetical protein QFC19_003039 [Naganishia cerealis]